MFTNRLYTGIASAAAITALAGGLFLFNTSGSTAPAAPAAGTAQSVTAIARDTSQRALSGVAVRIIDAAGTSVATGTTNAAGEVSMSFDPVAGTYAVVADEPVGYLSRDDKDGGASILRGGPPCSDVHLCVYLSATNVTHADGTTSVVVQLANVRPEQVGELDDVWFEMSPPPSPLDTDSDVSSEIGDPVAEELIGELVVDEIPENFVDDGLDGDDVLSGTPDPGTSLIGASPDDLFEGPPGLRTLCIAALHDPVASQNAASGVWFQGELNGPQSGSIFAAGPTINGGDPVLIPVSGGLFDGPLGINTFGGHEVTRFELQIDGSADLVNLLPMLADGFGTTLPVGPAEGAIFDNECHEFAPTSDPTAGPGAAQLGDDQIPQDVTQQDVIQQDEAELVEAQARVDAFLADFVADHRTSDSAALLATLHPAIPLAFGERICTDYVVRTTGSIMDATATSVGAVTELDLDTPSGMITFPEAIPFAVEFTLVDGTTIANDAHLALHDGGVRWLTMCGVEN